MENGRHSAGGVYGSPRLSVLENEELGVSGF